VKKSKISPCIILDGSLFGSKQYVRIKVLIVKLHYITLSFYSPVLPAYLNITDRRTHDLRGIIPRSLRYCAASCGKNILC